MFEDVHHIIVYGSGKLGATEKSILGKIGKPWWVYTTVHNVAIKSNQYQTYTLTHTHTHAQTHQHGYSLST